MRLGVLLLAVALPVGAQPPQQIEAFGLCVEVWARAHADAQATAYEVADAALEACPAARPGALMFADVVERSEYTHRLRAYARGRALRAVIEARTPPRR